MLHKKRITVAVVALLLIAGSLLATASNIVDQKATLSGPVSASGLVTPGTVVHEGDILVRVGTLTGAVPASRATTNGVVKEVLVTPGSKITVGDTVVRIEVGK